MRDAAGDNWKSSLRAPSTENDEAEGYFAPGFVCEDGGDDGGEEY